MGKIPQVRRNSTILNDTLIGNLTSLFNLTHLHASFTRDSAVLDHI